MAEIDTLIANARAYANEAVSGAITYVENFAALEDMINQLQFTSGLPTWSYDEIGDEAFSALDTVRSQEPEEPSVGEPPEWNYREISNRVFEVLDAITSQQPERPNDLGDFGDLEEPPDFEGIDPASLREAVRQLITLISNMPDMFAQAVTIFTAVNEKIISDLSTGGYGIDTSDELAIWERSRGRILQETEAEIDEMRLHHSTYNMPIPPGSYNRLLGKAVDKANDALSDFNRDMTIKRGDLYADARKHAIDSAIKAGEVQMGGMKIKIEGLRDAVAAEMGIIEAELSAHRALLSTYGYKFDKIINKQKVLSDIYKTDIAGWSARLGALTGAYGVLQQSNKDQFDADRVITNVYADYFRAKIEAWSARLGALTRAYGVLQQANTDQFNSDRATEAQEIQRARTQIDAFRAESEIRTRAMAEIANVFAHKVSGALTALNTLAAQIEQTVIT